MKLLLDNRGLILVISNDIEFGTFEGEKKWKVGNGLYFIDNNFTMAEVESIPVEVIPDKYYYIDGEFVLNPNYSNPSDMEAKIAELEALVASQAAEIEAQAEVLDYLVMQ